MKYLKLMLVFTIVWKLSSQVNWLTMYWSKHQCAIWVRGDGSNHVAALLNEAHAPDCVVV